MFMQTFILSSESTQLSRLITSLFITCETKSYVAIVNGRRPIPVIVLRVIFFILCNFYAVLHFVRKFLKKRCSMHS